MAEFDGYQVVITLLNEIKGLIKDQNPLIPVIAALVGAAVGAGMPILRDICKTSREQRAAKNAVASQLKAEIKAILDIVSTRNYIAFIQQQIVNLSGVPNGRSVVQIHVSEDFMPIYRSNLNNLHLLDQDTQVNVVKFYRYFSALIEDVKPGGTFNDPRFGFTVAGGNEFLQIANDAIALGNGLVISLDEFTKKHCCS